MGRWRALMGTGGCEGGGRPQGARAPSGARPLSNLPQRGKGRRGGEKTPPARLGDDEGCPYVMVRVCGSERRGGEGDS